MFFVHWWYYSFASQYASHMYAFGSKETSLMSIWFIGSPWGHEQENQHLSCSVIMVIDLSSRHLCFCGQLWGQTAAAMKWKGIEHCSPWVTTHTDPDRADELRERVKYWTVGWLPDWASEWSFMHVPAAPSMRTFCVIWLYISPAELLSYIYMVSAIVKHV